MSPQFSFSPVIYQNTYSMFGRDQHPKTSLLSNRARQSDQDSIQRKMNDMMSVANVPNSSLGERRTPSQKSSVNGNNTNQSSERGNNLQNLKATQLHVFASYFNCPEARLSPNHADVHQRRAQMEPRVSARIS